MNAVVMMTLHDFHYDGASEETEDRRRLQNIRLETLDTAKSQLLLAKCTNTKTMHQHHAPAPSSNAPYHIESEVSEMRISLFFRVELGCDVTRLCM